MTQLLPLSITLGAANTGKLIGYTVLDLDRTEYAAFALATESAVAGTYYADGGYSAPDAGGYLVVSESDGGDPVVLTPKWEVDIAPSSASLLAAMSATINAIKLITDGIDVSAVTVTTSNNAGELTIKRTATFAATVSGLSIPADWLAVIWTLKGAASDDEEDAVIQARVSNPADEEDDGLELLEAALPASRSLTAADGSVAVNQAGGSVALSLTAAATAIIEARGDAVWDLKVLRPSDQADELTTGTADIVYTVTHART